MRKARKTLRAVLPALALAALAACSGCATISTTKSGRLEGIAIKGASGEALEHVCLTTTGEHMFWAIPLGSGRFRWNEETQTLETETAWFQDNVGVAELQEALLKYADSRNCDVVDISFVDSDTSYAGVSYEGIIGILFGSSSMGVSGVLVPRAAAANN